MEPGEPVTECFFFPGSKEVFMNLRGFPQPMVHPSTPAFRMAATPDKGTALFSTRKLKAGDHILTERPLFVGARGAPTQYHANLTREQNTQHALNTLEQHFEVSFKRMSTESKAAFMALANSHKEDGSGPLVGVVRTNALALDDLRPGVKGDIGLYSAVCKDISRLNHSCSPNTSARFDMLSFSYQLFAVRDIAKSEELTYQYTPINCSAAERNKALVPYGFVCACTACTNASTSDPRRAAIEAFRPVVTEWVYDNALADDWLLIKCREHLELIMLEGMEQMPLHFDVVEALMETCICLGDAQGASEWAAKLESFMWEDVRADVKTLLDPASAAYQKHPLWRARLDRGPYGLHKSFNSLAELALKNGGALGPWGMVFPC
ncbi:hypothetical protein B0H17DRAFT_957150 [Mycena rosella]|uniref:SET domain-containing protein n=1 Tax=Mycena rosella TaxID=1033263 RepID=A0AAD7CMV3_MYCRO|nr:hypothetical protein B0H17DRAFT_957150 [Mycena rosella]